MVEYRGGTPFAVVASMLGYLVSAGTWLELAIAAVPEEDAESFEQLLAEEEISFACYDYRRNLLDKLGKRE